MFIFGLGYTHTIYYTHYTHTLHTHYTHTLHTHYSLLIKQDLLKPGDRWCP